MPHESTVNPNDVFIDAPVFCRRISRVPSYTNVDNHVFSPRPVNSDPKTPCSDSGDKNLVFDLPKASVAPKLNNNSRPQTPNVLNHDFDDESDEETEDL